MSRKHDKLNNNKTNKKTSVNERRHTKTVEQHQQQSVNTKTQNSDLVTLKPNLLEMRANNPYPS